MSQTPKPRRAIVNADDFGFSPAVTEGILRAHREGIVTSTTITANMPAAADAARRLAEAPGLGVGVHLNVSQGPPISREAAALADSDGLLRRSGAGVILACTCRPWLLAAVDAEYDAQIRWALDRGIRPTHLDTHRHAHAYPPIFSRVARLARRYHIRFVRRHREALPGGGWPVAPARQRRLSRLLNVLGAVCKRAAPDLMATGGTWGVAHTGAISEAWLLCAAQLLPPGATEIMTHPGLADDLEAASTRLVESRQAELAALCSPAVRQAFENSKIELTHYGRL